MNTRSDRASVLVLAVVALCLLSTVTEAAAASDVPTGPVTTAAPPELSPAAGTDQPAGPTREDVWSHLDRLGFPVGAGNSDNAEFRRGLCLAREFAGFKASRARLASREIAALLGLTHQLPPPVGALNGLNVSITCQVGYFVDGDTTLRLFRVTTGALDATPRGTFKVQRRTDGWRRSSLYPVNLYKPVSINGAIAVHGVPDPGMIRTVPSSHGCVRVPNRQMDWLFPRLTIGSPVRVYGRW